MDTYAIYYRCISDTMNKIKIINLCVGLSSLIGYLEWGKSQHRFIFQVIAELFTRKTSVHSFAHPLILLPFVGLLLLIITLFQKIPNRILSLLGLLLLSSIMLLLLFIGFMAPNIKMILAALPFLISGIFSLRYNWRKTK